MKTTKKNLKVKTIGVIAKDSSDFQNWKVSMGFDFETGDTVKKFSRKSLTYKLITKPEDLCGLTINAVTETEYAHTNIKYREIVLEAEIHIKSKYITTSRWFAILPVKTKNCGWVWLRMVDKTVDVRPVQYLGLLPEITYSV